MSDALDKIIKTETVIAKYEGDLTAEETEAIVDPAKDPRCVELIRITQFPDGTMTREVLFKR